MVQKRVVLPKKLKLDTIYRIGPRNADEKYYWERVDRNIGWITKTEQEVLRKTVIGIAGCGGMGGQLAEKFLRLGVGEIRIADCEVFDISNINRQFAATRFTVGKSKAFETARMLREISDDFTLEVYPQGISEETVDQFISGCDVVCDEIEFWAVGARILLHQQARKFKRPVFNCNTVGFGTRLFLFTHDSQTMEDCLGLSYQKAKLLQEKIQSRKASKDEIHEVMNSVLNGLVPAIPEYCAEESDYQNVIRLKERLFNEGKASIIATNPPMATGFLADRVLLHLLASSAIKRTAIETPKMPGYLYFDAAKMKAEIVRG
ncbi:MAG: molybdopterin and thiamine biosynthesis dinucleotide-utilizing enzyme [Parcubacteria group bacterium Gr01-1014_3]|nr:MAG: molybdopterin and thiamine biosynthesis dinucleotide-utilizing enzyme [Parcubacteria group bacterium Gr01-1014_3]